MNNNTQIFQLGFKMVKFVLATTTMIIVFLRVIDPGGGVWESSQSYGSLNEALATIEAGIAEWCRENGIELILSGE